MIRFIIFIFILTFSFALFILVLVMIWFTSLSILFFPTSFLIFFFFFIVFYINLILVVFTQAITLTQIKFLKLFFLCLMLTLPENLFFSLSLFRYLLLLLFYYHFLFPFWVWNTGNTIFTLLNSKNLKIIGVLTAVIIILLWGNLAWIWRQTDNLLSRLLGIRERKNWFI